MELNAAPVVTPPAAPQRDAGALPDPASPRAHALAQELGLSVTVADVLWRRGYADTAYLRSFLNPKLAELTQPDPMIDRHLAAERIASSIRRGEKIAIFGDYDCDGMTSAAILTEVLQALGGNVVTFLASRFEGGYGLTATAVGKILASGAQLLVTCDCGSSDHASIAALRARGLDTVVIDHHLVPSEPLPAVAFLNPHRPDCGFAYKGLASCGLVLSLAAALRKCLGKTLDLRAWLDLVAIGTIADVAPLNGDNRTLVRAGLKAIIDKPRPGIQALLDLAKISGPHPLTAGDVAFRIAPRLNAPGRMGAPDLAVELLLAKTQAAALPLAARIEQLTLERRAVQEQMYNEASAELEAARYHETPAIVLGKEGWNHGIVGIVAGRLAENYGLPVVVIGFQNGHGRGSLRAPSGTRLFDALERCKDLVVRFGGHQAAAGVELLAPQLPAFRAAFCEHIRDLAANGRSGESCRKSTLVPLASSDNLWKVVADLDLLEPCGEQNPAPEVVVSGTLRSAREVGTGHLKLELDLERRGTLSAFGLNMGRHAAQIGKQVMLSGSLRRDSYRGGEAVELRIERIW